MKSSQALYLDRLSNLVELQKRISTISPIFSNHYPVTIVVDNTFEVYDVICKRDGYVFIKSVPCPLPIPQGVLAAFPLECYDNKTSAIVSPDAFSTQEGYVYILHEFVHCAQSIECETILKDQLGITQDYKLKKDYTWEINHPFPYEDPSFVCLFQQYMETLQTHNHPDIAVMRRKLKGILSRIDFEYLLWQEWKEGLARFWEDKIRKHLGIPDNHQGNEMPFNRISFYESGCRFISAIEKATPGGVNDMRELFNEMKS